MKTKNQNDIRFEVQQPLPANEKYKKCIGISAEEASWGCRRKEYLIKEEEEALSMLRQIKKQAIPIKKRIGEIKNLVDFDFLKKEKEQLSPEERAKYVEQKKLHAELEVCEERLNELRIQWKAWDEKRKQATRIKMVILGHSS
jgi:hypothetical protein